MTRFRVHLEDGEIVPVDADTPADAAAQVRKARKGAIVRKVKRDKTLHVGVGKYEIGRVWLNGQEMSSEELKQHVECGDFVNATFIVNGRKRSVVLV